MSDIDQSDVDSPWTAASSPPPVKQRTPQLFLEVEDKTEEAKTKFTELDACTYSSKAIGSSGQQEYMTCDCVEDWDSDIKRNLACSEDSNCINRVTSVECINGHCGCGKNCQNQRFQKKQYASVSVIQTELKGYGLRADKTISENSFIYEYIGEVIDEETFRKRMIEYDAKNFKHFYFMMLKNDSFIDATLKGSLARFCNHSCSPNAYVDKWVVGDKLRMGIFAKRTIMKGEEITFDYNVDRYGAQSQPCYCGEPNCIKFMGGKTQTDAALLLPEGIAEALGVTPKQERQWLKENKHLRSKQQSDDSVINEKFVSEIEINELKEADVSKVMGALMKSQDHHIIKKLIERIHMTNDDFINSLIIRFHGYKTLSTIIKEFKSEDENLVISILEILTKWPKVTRNKISSSQIESVIQDINKNTTNDEISSLTQGLLDDWSKLQMAYRIPKSKSNTSMSYGRNTRSPESEEPVSYRPAVDVLQPGEDPLPAGWEVAFDENSKSNYYFHRALNLTRWERPVASVPTGPKPPSGPRHGDRGTPKNGFKETGFARREEEKLKQEKESQFHKLQEKERQLQQLIQQTGEQERKKQLEEKLAKASAKLSKKSSSTSSNGHPSSASTEAKWTHVLAKHVPNLIKKYESEVGRDNIKGCARDLVKILAAKEIKKDPKSSPPRELDHHKLKKVKEYSKVFMEKFLLKYRAKHDKQVRHDKHRGTKRDHDDKNEDDDYEPTDLHDDKRVKKSV
ncbi:uncharacterized protein RJT20DRAFT_117255 [Scheffersomyces xylosifermentans]|uniref:uncharacterized protein n=1 Tax=Scheffersomyces xylosifermentans TaxID=1304137 RepID=UPI00315D4AF0